MLCMAGAASIPNKQTHESMYVYVREVLVALQNSHCVFGAENKSLGKYDWEWVSKGTYEK